MSPPPLRQETPFLLSYVPCGQRLPCEEGQRAFVGRGQVHCEGADSRTWPLSGDPFAPFEIRQVGAGRLRRSHSAFPVRLDKQRVVIIVRV